MTTEQCRAKTCCAPTTPVTLCMGFYVGPGVTPNTEPFSVPQWQEFLAPLSLVGPPRRTWSVADQNATTRRRAAVHLPSAPPPGACDPAAAGALTGRADVTTISFRSTVIPPQRNSACEQPLRRPPSPQPPAPRPLLSVSGPFCSGYFVRRDPTVCGPVCLASVTPCDVFEVHHIIP